MLSGARAGLSALMPRSAVLYAPPLAETAFLVEAAARVAPGATGRTDRLLSLFAELEARDRSALETAAE